MLLFNRVRFSRPRSSNSPLFSSAPAKVNKGSGLDPSTPKQPIQPHGWCTKYEKNCSKDSNYSNLSTKCISIFGLEMPALFQRKENHSSRSYCSSPDWAGDSFSRSYCKGWGSSPCMALPTTPCFPVSTDLSCKKLSLKIIIPRSTPGVWIRKVKFHSHFVCGTNKNDLKVVKLKGFCGWPWGRTI